MPISWRVFSLAVLLAVPAQAFAAGDPCAGAARASPLQPSRGRLVISRDVAEYSARHAEFVCAKLEALLRDVKSKSAAVPKARAIEGEFETAVLAPIFQRYPDLRGRDLATADAPGAQVKLGPLKTKAEPHMGPLTAGHLSWVAIDAERRVFALADLGCHVLGIGWLTMTRWRGPDDATWHEKGPSLGIGAWNCGQYPADVVRTVGGMKVIFNGDTADRFAGNTIDVADKQFVLIGP